MLAQLRSSLTYANVMATVAVFVALGGTSYAVATGSIDSREIKNAAVRSKDVRNNNLRGRDVRNESIGTRDVQGLLAEDFTPGQLPAGERGPQGPQGRPGQDATKLFAYVSDAGSVATATLEYGSGVTALNDPDGPTSYTLTFNRSLVNCVVQAVPGFGDPQGSGAIAAASMAEVGVSSGGANEVNVTFRNPSFSTVDTSFMVAAFC